jgi:DNA-binding transcriptional LysR family regulator
MDRLKTIEEFVRTVEAGSFSAAARQMRVGQPAISKSIAALEKRLGVQLLMRSTRGLTPTEAGRHFYHHAQRTIEEANEADNAARGEGNGFSGHLRIGAGVTFASLHLVPRIPLFLAKHPGLSIDLVLDDGPIDIIQEGIEVAFRSGELRDSGLTARKIATSARLVVATPAYFDAAGVPQTPSDLAEHSAVIYTQGGSGGCTWNFRKGISQITVRISGSLRVSAAEAVRAAVITNTAFAIASEWMFSPELKTGAVRRVLTDWELPTVDMWAVFPSGRMASASARAFATFVKAELVEWRRGLHTSQVGTSDDPPVIPAWNDEKSPDVTSARDVARYGVRAIE